MRFVLVGLLALASVVAVSAQTPVPSPEQRDAIKKIADARGTAARGKVTDLVRLLEAARAGVAADPACRQGSQCATKEAAADLLLTWVENWNCQEATSNAADDRVIILELKTALESLGAPQQAAGASDMQRTLAKRVQEAIDKIERCRGLIWSGPSGSVWFASVAPDMPSHEKEHWMVNCGPTPFGRWTIMRTEGPAATAHEILGGVLDMKENGRGQYSLTGVGKSNQRGNYKETGDAELSELPGAPGMYMIVLRGTWSDRVADGRGGWVAKNFKFGDISFGVERRKMPCPMKQ